MSGVVEFLLARLDEDEAQSKDARVFVRGVDEVGESYFTYEDVSARVLADVAAKRRIVEAGSHIASYERVEIRQGVHEKRPVRAVFDESEWVVRTLASAYSSHPDYDKSWRP